MKTRSCFKLDMIHPMEHPLQYSLHMKWESLFSADPLSLKLENLICCFGIISCWLMSLLCWSVWGWIYICKWITIQNIFCYKICFYWSITIIYDIGAWNKESWSHRQIILSDRSTSFDSWPNKDFLPHVTKISFLQMKSNQFKFVKISMNKKHVLNRGKYGWN